MAPDLHTAGDAARLELDYRETVSDADVEWFGHPIGEPVEIHASSAQWAADGQAWEHRLTEALHPLTVRVDHIGSTSVPGLAAKPVIDVQVQVPDLHDEAAYLPALRGLGLVVRARGADFRFLRPPEGQPRTVHVHVCEIGSGWAADHLAFRDALRADPALAAEYERLKRTLAATTADRAEYTAAKAPFIRGVIGRGAIGMEIVLVPGLWLDGSSWDAVVPLLAAAGHRCHPLTLPGVGMPAPESSGIGMSDWVDAVAAQIDECDGPVVLVDHSAGGNVTWGAADARTDRIARVIFVDTVPAADGAPMPSFRLADGVIPFVGWDSFPDTEVTDLDATTRAATATPSAPAGISADSFRLRNPARSSIPVTVLMGSLDRAGLEAEIAEDAARFGTEYHAIQNLEVLTIGSGHWPQLSAPHRLAELIIDAIGRRGSEA